MDQHHSRHNSTETLIYTGQVFFLAKLEDQGWFLGSWLVNNITLMLTPPEVLDSGEQHIVPGQVTSQKAFQPVPRVCTAQHRWTHHSVGAQWVAMLHLLEQRGGLCSLLPPLSIFFFRFYEERRDHLAGRTLRHWLHREELEWEELLIITPHLLQAYARQSPSHQEQWHSGKAGTVVTQTLQIQTQLHTPSFPLRLGHTAGSAAPRLHSSSCFF